MDRQVMRDTGKPFDDLIWHLGHGGVPKDQVEGEFGKRIITTPKLEIIKDEYEKIHHRIAMYLQSGAVVLEDGVYHFSDSRRELYSLPPRPKARHKQRKT